MPPRRACLASCAATLQMASMAHLVLQVRRPQEAKLDTAQVVCFPSFALRPSGVVCIRSRSPSLTPLLLHHVKLGLRVLYLSGGGTHSRTCRECAATSASNISRCHHDAQQVVWPSMDGALHHDGSGELAGATEDASHPLDSLATSFSRLHATAAPLACFNANAMECAACEGVESWRWMGATEPVRFAAGAQLGVDAAILRQEGPRTRSRRHHRHSY